jgi:hypothetical protein
VDTIGRLFHLHTKQSDKTPFACRHNSADYLMLTQHDMGLPADFCRLHSWAHWHLAPKPC